MYCTAMACHVWIPNLMQNSDIIYCYTHFEETKFGIQMLSVEINTQAKVYCNIMDTYIPL